MIKSDEPKSRRAKNRTKAHYVIAMDDKQLGEGLVRLSEKTGFSITEIYYIAQILAQVDFDPLAPNEWGAPFKFTKRKVSLFDNDFDLNSINSEVPNANAQVDLTLMWREFKRDAESVARIFNDTERVRRLYEMPTNLCVDKCWLVLKNSRDWAHFWSVRHSKPEVRANFAVTFRTLEAAAERSKARARKHGIDLREPQSN